MITDEQKQKLCLSCMRCCKQIGIPIPIDKDDKDSISFYQERGYTVYIIRGVVVLFKEEQCPHLTDFGCDIYPWRPKVCKEFDGSLEESPFKPLDCLWKKGNEATKEETDHKKGDSPNDNARYNGDRNGEETI